MRILIPIKFNPIFEKTHNYYYQSHKGIAKVNLIKSLVNSSNKYCMYTYEKVENGSSEFIGQLEHSIEQSSYKGSGINPFHCKFNLSVSTGIANNTYKKNMKSVVITEDFFKCKKNYDCSVACSDLIDSHVESMLSNNFFLMPNKFSAHLKFKECDLIYDLLKLEFKVSDKAGGYSRILDNHINVFRLNDNKGIESEINNICTTIVSHGRPSELLNILKNSMLSNYTSLLFINYLENFSDKRCLSICRLIISNKSIPLVTKVSNKSILLVKKISDNSIPIIKKINAREPGTNSSVPFSRTYLTKEKYGAAKRRFVNKEILEEIHAPGSYFYINSVWED